MSDLREFLKSRGISDDIIKKLEDDKIDSLSIPFITDDELKGYIPLIGDRLALRFFVNNNNNSKDKVESSRSLRKESVLDRLRRKLKEQNRSRSSHDGSDSDSGNRCEEEDDVNRKKLLCPLGGNKNALRGTRIVQIGLILVGDNEAKTVIRVKDGGGLRRVKVSKNCSIPQLEAMATDLFFPNGIAKFGQLSDFDCSMTDFQESTLQNHCTVEEMYNTIKLPVLRFFLKVTRKLCESPTKNLGSLSTTMPDPLQLVECSSVNIDECNWGEEIENPLSVHAVDTAMTMFSGDAIELDNSVLFEGFTSSSTYAGIESVSGEAHPKCLADALIILSKSIVDSTPRNIINVIRSDVLDGGYRGFLRQSFDCNKKLSVKFASESAIDDGGPTREFLRLAYKEIAASSLFYGPDNQKFLSLDASSLSSRTYEAAGRILAYGLVHRGPLPAFLDPIFYYFLTSGGDNFITPIPDYAIPMSYRELIHELDEAKDQEYFGRAIENLIDLIDISGSSGYLQFDKKDALIDALKKFIVFDRLKPAIDQFRAGLSILGVLEMAIKYPNIMSEAFTHSVRTLDSSLLTLLLEVPNECWSPKGSTRRVDEERVYSLFCDFLLDIEESGEQELKKLLQFVTGSSEVPVLGFDPPTRVTFRHRVDLMADDPTYEFPIANTCSNTLSLPCSVNSYDIFKNRILAAINVDAFTSE